MKRNLILGLVILISSLNLEIYPQQRKSRATTKRPLISETQKRVALPRVILINENGLKQVLSPKGKPLLVNFWATWCAPCREEFPDLVKISTDYRGKIDVVTVSLDDPVEINRDVPKFISEMKATMPAYLLKATNEGAAINMVSKRWEGGLPFTILLSSDGKEFYSRSGKFNTAVLRRQIEKLILEEASK